MNYPLALQAWKEEGAEAWAVFVFQVLRKLGEPPPPSPGASVFSKGKYFLSSISHYTRIQIPPVPVVRDTLSTSFHTWILQVKVQDSLLPRSLPWLWPSFSFFIQSDFFLTFVKSWCSAVMPSSLAVSYHLFPCPHCKSLELTVLATEK